jgi:hypothetical protein
MVVRDGSKRWYKEITLRGDIVRDNIIARNDSKRW